MAVGATLQTVLFGNAGDDEIWDFYRGKNDGTVSIPVIDAGIGNDLFTIFGDGA